MRTPSLTEKKTYSQRTPTSVGQPSLPDGTRVASYIK